MKSWNELHVVITDDEESIRKLLIKMLIRLGFVAENIHQFSNPEDALEHIAEHGADVVLSDFDMKCKMTGVGFAKRLEQTEWVGIFVLITGNINSPDSARTFADDLRVLCQKQGCSVGLCAKPMRPTDLMVLMIKLLPNLPPHFYDFDGITALAPARTLSPPKP